MAARNSVRSGTTISAAADGVGARTSAAKSASVTSDSCPTPETTGTPWATIARTTASSLNAHRSSSDPPPRARIVTSGASSGRPAAIRSSRYRSTLRSAATRLAGRRLALDLRGDEHDAGQRPAPGEDVADVLPDRAGRAGDDGDRRRPARQRALASLVEQALGRQARLERLEPQREVAEAGRLDRVDVELERALRLEQVDPAVGDDPQPGLRLERRAQPVVAEPDALELVALVLQREVGVPGRRDRDPPDLALDPQVGQPRIRPDRDADRPGDLADAEDAHAERARRRRRRRAGRGGLRGHPRTVSPGR